MVLYIRNLDEETFASKVYKEQKLKKLPGLAAETLKICDILHIEDCNETQQDISIYKLIVLKALHRKNEKKTSVFWVRESVKGFCMNHMRKRNIYITKIYLI